MQNEKLTLEIVDLLKRHDVLVQDGSPQNIRIKVEPCFEVNVEVVY